MKKKVKLISGVLLIAAGVQTALALEICYKCIGNDCYKIDCPKGDNDKPKGDK
ncbi:hypothetical protein [Aliikangiella sp. IMCC44359]|uniref:hypothetical protein n=1 Tax=Aliikangiella sp. IMCC44359 TaxID=3459125 RepID=UPI00403ACFEA